MGLEVFPPCLRIQQLPHPLGGRSSDPRTGGVPEPKRFGALLALPIDERQKTDPIKDRSLLWLRPGDLQQSGIDVTGSAAHPGHAWSLDAGRPFEDGRDEEAAIIDLALVAAVSTGRADSRQCAIVAAIPENGVFPNPPLLELITQHAKGPIHAGDLTQKVLIAFRQLLIGRTIPGNRLVRSMG